MIYFDNAATSYPKPKMVKEAVSQSLDFFANPSRGNHSSSLNALRCLEMLRLKVASLFNCEDSQRIAFCKNVTEALNIAINSIDGHIVTTASEHNSVLRPVFRKKNFTVVDIDEYGCYTAHEILKAIQKDTAAVVLAHGSNVTGQIHPIEDIGALCRQHNILFIVDAAQSAGLVDIDMQKCYIDALCFTGHKSLYGPTGTGGICLSSRFTVKPLIVGGTGIHSFDPQQPANMPTVLEAGTMNGHGLAGLSAGIDYISQKGLKSLRTKAKEVADEFYNELKKIKHVRFYGKPENESTLPIVTFNIGDIPSDEIAAALDEQFSIAVRPGAHCAPLLHKKFGTEKQGAVRFSFSHYNKSEELPIALEALYNFSQSL